MSSKQLIDATAAFVGAWGAGPGSEAKLRELLSPGVLFEPDGVVFRQELKGAPEHHCHMQPPHPPPHVTRALALSAHVRDSAWSPCSRVRRLKQAAAGAIDGARQAGSWAKRARRSLQQHPGFSTTRQPRCLPRPHLRPAHTRCEGADSVVAAMQRQHGRLAHRRYDAVAVASNPEERTAFAAVAWEYSDNNGEQGQPRWVKQGVHAGRGEREGESCVCVCTCVCERESVCTCVYVCGVALGGIK
jgi:hypothetical protein